MAEITITAQNFENEVLNSDIPALVDFWATWCGPCRMLAPVIAQAADDYAGKLKVCKVNVDEQQELAIRYRVSGIPTVLIFKDGQIADTMVGYSPYEELKAMIDKAL